MFRQLKGASGQGGSQGGAASGSNSCPSNSRKSGGGGGPPPRAPGALGGGCRYPHRVCSQPPLDHYEYCIKHILEDKNAPYKPCGYTYASNNKRCLQPAARGDKRDIGYCAAHLWKTQLKRQRSMAKYVPPVTREALLAGLAHYVRPIRGGASGDGDDSTNPSLTRALDPFVEADVSKAGLWRAHVLECASESDSDVEPANHDTVWSATNEDSSDAESIDSTMDDPIRHAAMYTAEEVVTITRNKQMRLQKLYKRQFDRLIHVLRERRRNCLHGLKKEKETHCPIYDKGRVSAKEQKVYDKLKALNGYQKRSPTETVAYIANLEKRAKEKAGANYKPTGHNPKCTFTEGGVRCAKATLPLTKFCFKHILDDPNQLIFKACGCRKPDSTECRETICSNLSSSETCLLHIRLPQLPHLNLLVSLPLYKFSLHGIL
ncbi:hypothetical protein AAG570_001122 [Ranatra chinensis]|uniref:KAT8 regulatory NSL complex subunit 2 n=1 Tax=Ranatra chinensis TaxID=642074 RepID=A0ABD0YAY0_9HEMI